MPLKDEFNININNDEEIDNLINKGDFAEKFANLNLINPSIQENRIFDDNNIKRNLYKESIEKLKLFDEMISSKNNKENIIYYKDILKIRDIKRYNGSYDNCSLYKSSISSSKNIFSMSSLHKKDNENKKWPLSKGNTSRSGLDSINENSSSIGDYQFNIAFIGDSNVGKSELLQKECRNIIFKIIKIYTIYIFII